MKNGENVNYVQITLTFSSSCQRLQEIYCQKKGQSPIRINNTMFYIYFIIIFTLVPIWFNISHDIILISMERCISG